MSPHEASERTRTENKQRPSGLVLPWGLLTVILGLIAVGAVGTLAVVTSVQDVDTLSTVAMALAILSFAAQLIITLIQSQQSSQVNADTKTALADVRATTSSLLTNQREQFDKVLQAALGTAITAAVQDVEQDSTQDDDAGNGDNSESQRADELEQRLSVRLNEEIQRLSSQVRSVSDWSTISPSTYSLRRVPESASSRDPRIIELLRTYPDKEEGQPVNDELKTLPPRVIGILAKVGTQLQRTPRPDYTVRFRRTGGETSVGYDELLSSGFIELVENETTRDRIVYRLTPKGLIAVRLLMAKGPQPDWVAS